MVACARGDGYRELLEALAPYGPVAPAGFFNVLVARVEEPVAVLEDLRRRLEAEPGLAACLGRLIWLEQTLPFGDPAELEAALWRCLERKLPVLAGCTFHTRVHRRGLKGRLSGRTLERSLNHHLVARLRALGRPGYVSFRDPDWVLAVETVGPRAGLSCWDREARRRYPFLGL
ncbi:MAG: hypothetical protein D6809_06320 [Gammaproteobacteria bacterium]|nr:MAG: hypothetical protein D6809_06320 [Gammaproteobacteria bacterium]